MVRKILFFFLYHIGIGSLLSAKNKRSNKIPVLLFHRVTNDKDIFWEPYNPKLFSEVISFLSSKYQFISLPDLFKQPKENLQNACMITFDDGYDDFIENALPSLKQHNIKPVFFLTTNCINNNTIVWTSELNKAIDNTDKKELLIEIDGIKKTFLLNSISNKIATAITLLKTLKKMANKDRLNLLEEIKDKLDYSKPSNQNMMSWNTLRTLNNDVDFQSHTVSHPFMQRLNDTELEHELSQSKKDIEANLSSKVNCLSYPIGGYNEKVINNTKKHYEAAFAVDDDLLDLNKISNVEYRFKLPRINITDQSKYEVYLRINGFHKIFKGK